MKLRPRRRTTIEPSFFFSELSEFRFFMVILSSSLSENGSQLAAIPPAVAARQLGEDDWPMAQVVAIDDGSEVFGDPRDGGRALRVNWHSEDGFVVLSLWRDQLCVATSRVAAADVPALIETLVRGLRPSVVSPDGPIVNGASSSGDSWGDSGGSRAGLASTG
jgi:hypothetical protein